MTSKLHIRLEKLLHECYIELFANSEPKGDFRELLKTSPKNEKGQIEIPYNDYVIEEKVMEEIVSKYCKLIKLKYYRDRFKNEVYLGCSPRTKINK